MSTPVSAVVAPRAERAVVRIGVGIDASRYGHHAVFLREDLQPAAAELSFAESAAGYTQFRERLEKIVHKQGCVQFTIRLDAAGQYADNLLHFLQTLSLPGTSFTVEASSGIDRDGRPRGPKRYVMSRRGNDLVRRYLWMAALSAVKCNAPVRTLYARVVAKHTDHKSIAIGHGMRKLLHLAHAIWKTGRPFDPTRCPAAMMNVELGAEPSPETKQAAGLKPDSPAAKEVTTACDSRIASAERGQQAFVDFAHLKRQLPIQRVLDQLGLTAKLRGSGPQRRCACPIHRGDARGRTFSVNLAENVFHCHDAACGKEGDAIDLWAALRSMSLRAAALDLVQTFQLEPAPAHHEAEKRHG